MSRPPDYVRGVAPAMVLAMGVSINSTSLAVLGCTAAWGCAAILRHALVLPAVAAYAIYAAIGAAALWHLVGLIAPNWTGARTTTGLPPGPDAAYRVRCSGSRGQIERLGPLTDQAFEPEVFDGSLAHGGMPGSSWGRLVTSLAGVAVAALGFRLATGRWFFAPGAAGMMWGVLMVGVMLGGLLASVLWPVYYRVMPGRIDQVRTGFLARGPVSVRSWSLRHCGVLVVLPRRAVIIDPPGSPRLVLSAALLGKKYEFERAVLLGAISSAKTLDGETDLLEG